MCGILGGFLKKNSKISKQKTFDCLKKLTKRGPDSRKLDFKDFKFGDFVLGHTRLSIIDISKNANQPMYSNNGRYGLIFNGVITNFVELKKDLKTKGRKFYTCSDSEVLLAAWQEWQEDSIMKLDGMFAFGIFDFYKKTITLVRDRYGTKPMYYQFFEKEFLFSSEISVLKELNHTKNELNLNRVLEYLEYGKYDFEEQTFFKNIFNLKPGHLIRINISKQITHDQIIWHKFQNDQNNLPYEDAVELTRNFFLKSISTNLRSDVSIGAALSGGIDSSSIVCAIKYLEPDFDLNTFSFIDQNSKTSEEKWVNVVNSYTGFKNHKIKTNKNLINKDFDKLLLAQGEPFAGPSIYAQYIVYNTIKNNGIKVCLDGQGADEIIGGYNGFPGFRLHSLIEKKNYDIAYNFINSWSKYTNYSRLDALKRLLDSITTGSFNGFLKKINKLGNNFIYTDKNFFYENCVHFKSYEMKNDINYKGRRMIEYLKYSISNYGLQSLLRHGDRNSMHFSVGRVPFLSNEFVDFMLTLPENFLVSDKGQSKYIFKDAMKGILPNEILMRKDKIGFEVNGTNFLFQLKSNIDDWLKNDIKLPFLKTNKIKKDLDLFFSRKKVFTYEIWRVLNFYRWYQLNF